MKKAHLMGPLTLLLAVGCSLQLPYPPGTTPQPSGHITVQVVAPYPTETPAICTDLPEGAALRVTPLSATEVQVEVRGMQAGERLSFQFIGRPAPDGRWRRVSEWPVEGVKEDGTYTLTSGGLAPARGSTVNAWTIKVIHGRGVACQEIVLPMP